MPGKHVHFASSPQTFTPPSINFSGSPYESSPLPDVDPAEINFYLAPFTLQHCVVNPHSYATFKGFPLAANVLGQVATSIPLPRLTFILRTSQTKLPWTISITPASTPCVTVGDVLRGVYYALDQDASQREYEAAPTAMQKDISRAFTARCNGRPDIEKHGLKRVDFLGPNVRWEGLTPTKKGPDVWELHVSS